MRSRQHSAISSRASSVRGSPPEEEGVANETMVSPNVELERAKLKIKKLEREVWEGQWRERYRRDSGERGKETVEREVREGQ